MVFRLQFHVRRWVGRTLKELRETLPEDWQWALEEIKSLLTDLPPEGSWRLFELCKQSVSAGQHGKVPAT